MSYVMKLVIPIVIVVTLIALYMTKAPSLLFSSKVKAPSESSQPMPAPVEEIRTNEQLDLDLAAIDSEIVTATNESTGAQSFDDSPIAQTE